MAPKKKGKGKGMGKMSEEDKARYLQHKADMEEEARRRKQELIGMYMKNKLHREEAFLKINQAKINQQWRFILRKIKVKDMRDELQVIISTFKRTIDSKNRFISKLMDSLDLAEEQYSYMLQSHMELISDFIGIKEDRLKLFQDSYEEQKFTLMEQWDEELQNIEVSQKDAEYKLNCVIFQQEKNMQKHVKDYEDAKEHLLHVTIIILDQELSDIVLPKQLQIESIWNDMRNIFSDYLNYHGPKIQQYQLMRQKDATYRKEINNNVELVLAANDMINYYQQLWDSTYRELELMTRSNKEKRDTITNMSAKAKADMVTNYARDKEQMIVLSNESYDALKRLDKLSEKGQKILQMYATCRKYETENDCIRSWKTSTSLLDANNMTKEMMLDVETYEEMENLWFKINRVNVQTATLKAEYNTLCQENRRLKRNLKNVLVEAALGTTGSVRGETPGRPASMRMYRIVPLVGDVSNMKRRPVTCIEASTCNAVQHARRVNQWREKGKPQAFVRRQCW